MAPGLPRSLDTTIVSNFYHIPNTKLVKIGVVVVPFYGCTSSLKCLAM